MQPHPQVPWIVAGAVSPIAVQIVCTQCRVGGTLRAGPQVDAFIAQHMHAPAYYGAGDLVAGLTKRLGFEQCSPCEERQQTLNRWFPRVWRR